MEYVQRLYRRILNMKKIGILYDYLFYTIYRFWEKAPSRWWSDWKTVITICFLTVLMILSIYGNVMYIFRINLLPNSGILPLIIGILVFGFNYLYFLFKDKWKNRILKFEKLSRKKDLLGITLVMIFSITIILSLLYSYYLISTIDWKSIREVQ